MFPLHAARVGKTGEKAAVSGRDEAGGDRAGAADSGLSRLLWYATGLSAAAALALAFAGWTLEYSWAGHQDALPRPDGKPLDGWALWTEVASRTLYVLFLSDIYTGLAASVGNPTARLLLEVARTLGAAFAALAATRILFFAAATRLSEWRIRGKKAHVIAIGSGPAAREYAVAAGKGRTVHIEDGVESTVGAHARLRRAGPLSHQLRSAGVGRAKRLIVDEGDDAATWNTAQQAARLYPQLQVIAHIQDQWLSERLARADQTTRLRAFSYAGGVARQVMLAHPPFLLARAMAAPSQHILIHGFGDVGQALLREFMVTSMGPEPAPLMVTVIDRNADALEAEFEGRHPGLAAFADIRFLRGDLRISDQTIEAAVRARNAKAEICAAYVASSRETSSVLGVAAALRDRAARLDLFRSPIFVCADHGAGLPRVDQGAGRLGALEADIKVRAAQLSSAQQDAKLCDLRLVGFGSWRDALDGAGLFEPDLDGAAQAFHDAYRKNSSYPAPEWKSLSEDFRVSNRRAAAHIRAKAAAAGFDLNSWLESGKGPRLSHQLPKAASSFPEGDRIFERRMAELEHTRWAIDRVLDGWSYGPVRDNIARKQPLLVPFSKLDQTERDKDTAVVTVTRTILQAQGEV